MARKLSKKDYEFMHSLSSAMLETTPRRLRLVLIFWVVAIFSFLVWAYYAPINEGSR